MLTILMAGGLGNQLFQYAAVRRLAQILHEGVEIDTRFFSQQSEGTTTGFWIDQLPIKATVKKYPHSGPFAAHAFVPRLKRKLLDEKLRPTYKETCVGFDPSFFDVRKNSIILGYFQSYKYLGPKDATLVDELSPIALLSEADHALLVKIRSAKVASIHVRRGDYLSLPGFQLANSERFIADAMAYLLAEHPDLEFLVFSDDIDWCRSAPIFATGCAFHEAIHGRHPMIDLYLMSNCAHHIISNSSYSWWAAWLGDLPGKRIISPAIWISGLESRKSGIIPDHWITL